MKRIRCDDTGTASAIVCDGLHAMAADGAVILDGLFSVEFINSLHREFMRRCAGPDPTRQSSFGMEVGHRRHMTTVQLAGVFGNPQVYANALLMPLIEACLGKAPILENFGAVSSFPGAKPQHVHRDGPPLFTETGLSGLLPAHAIVIAIPLIAMNALNGTTAIWPGSHRWQPSSSAKDADPVVPDIPIGSCIVWDYRVLHGGTANRSGRTRPLMYLSYARSWYRDPVNYTSGKQPRLLFDQQFIDSLPDDHRHLFSHVA